jgi:hypothetical protein
VIDNSLAIVSTPIDGEHRHESKANGCPATPKALQIVLFGSEGADCNGEDQKAISKEELYP